MDLQTALEVIEEKGYVIDIGQLTGIRKDLDKMVRHGELKKGRAHWYPGLGNLKTTYYKEGTAVIVSNLVFKTA